MMNTKRHWILLAGACSLALMLVHCSGASGSKSMVCSPGASISCACSNGDQGAQVCESDGSGYEACSCGTGTTTGTTTGTKTGTTTGTTTGTPTGTTTGTPTGTTTETTTETTTPAPGPTAFVGTWDLSGTQTFTDCVGSCASSSATDSFAAVITWTAGGPGLIGNTGGECDFDDTVSGNTATLSGGAVVCTGSGAGGAEVQSTYDNFTWVLGAGGTTATVSQTGSQISTGAAGECTCQMVISLVATRQ